MGLFAKKVMLALLMSMTIFSSVTYAQSQTCVIDAPDEPDMIFATRFPGTVGEIIHEASTTNWDGLGNARIADDLYLEANLERYESTHIIRFSDFGFNVPAEAIVDGLRISINGQSIGDGEVENMQLQFYNNGPIGEDRATLPAMIGEDWINDTLAIDRWWKYGHFHDTWNKDWNSSEVNSSDFGFVLQIKNPTNESIQAIIDQVSVTIYYSPPYNLCDHECVVFSTAPVSGITNYNWSFPNIFEQIVSPVNEEILNLRVLENIPGTYQVCVTPEGQSQCCREFVIVECNPGSVGNRVWKDDNNNGIQDAGEEGVADVRVSIYNENGTILGDQFTDENGNYLFTDLHAGNYRINTSAPTEDCELSLISTGDDNTNSDYDLAYGPRSSGIFSIAPGEHRDDIDFGWAFKNGSLAGCVFRDRNGDSLQGDDPGMNGITVQLSSCDGNLITSTLTNEQGIFSFQDLAPGEYFLSTPTYQGFISASGGDSAFGEASYSSHCVEVIPNEEQTLKLGFTPLGQIGDYVFYDENSNGLQDSGDWPIGGIQMTLLDGNNNVLSSTITSEEGFYLFIDLPSGDYSVIADYPTGFYLPTNTNAGDSQLDSDGIDIGNQQVQSGLINLYDGESELDHDFGFVKRTATVSGSYFMDGNGDGNFTDDQGIANMVVALYNCNSTLIATRTTDENGNFSFTAFVGLDYHLVFTPVSGMAFSTNGQSSIDNVITQGATNCFSVNDETPLTINGATVPFSRVGDMVWEDTNGDGLYNQDEPGMANVSVKLFNSNNEEVATTVTNAEGRYIFDNILPDLCYLVIDAQVDYEITLANVGNDDSKDSDGVLIDNVITSENFQIQNGYENMDMDFGFTRSGGSISGSLWLDGNGDASYGAEGTIADRRISLMTCDGNLVSSTITNQQGAFGFNQISAGDYYLVSEWVDGFVHAIGGDSDITNNIEEGSTSCFSVSSGSNTNFTLGTIPTSNIGDFVWNDANGNGLQDDIEEGLPSVTIKLLNNNGVELNSTSTDANGWYSFDDIPAGEYSLEVNIPLGMNLTDSGLGDSSLRDGLDQDDHDFGFISTSGNLQGTVWRDSNGDELFIAEAGVPAITVSLYSCDLVLIDSQLTDADGNYQFSNLTAGDYFIVTSLPDIFEFALSGDSGITNQFMPGSTDCLTVNGSSNTVSNIGMIPIGIIGNLVWFDENKDGIQNLGEAGLENIDVGLMNGQGAMLELTKTDQDGGYLFRDLRPGQYVVSVMIPGDEYTLTTPFSGDDISIDSEGTIVNGMVLSETIDLFDGQYLFHHDFGFILKDVEPELGTIGGTFKRDRDGDGILSDEPGISDQLITLMHCDGTMVNTTTTDDMGNFTFPPVDEGEYYIVFPDQINSTIVTFGESQIDNVIEEGSTDCVSVMANTTVTVTGGAIPLNKIGDFVWNDENKNGIQDSDEAGLGNITIELFDSADVFISSVESDENGFYEFTEVLPGNYYISVIIGDYLVSPSNVGSETTDSNLEIVDDLALALIDNLYDGVTIQDLDFGLYEEEENTGTEENIINGIVFEDLNGNGLIDVGEPRVNDVTVNLMTLNGDIMDNTESSSTLSEEGYYEFVGFPNEIYRLTFDLDPDSKATTKFIGINPALNSNISLSDGEFKTDIYDFSMGGIVNNVNAGFYFPVSIGDFVWFDFDADGLQGNDEPGANDFVVRLYNDSGIQQSMTTTQTNPDNNDNGYYSFDDLRPGRYYIGINLGFGVSVTSENEGDDNLDSDVDNSNGPGTTAMIDLNSGEENTNTDIGILATPGSVGNYLWIDNNGNGIQDFTEPGVNDVPVKLYDENSTLIMETTTQDDNEGDAGYYRFENITSGNYFVVFDLPEGYLPTAPFKGGNSSRDSDVTETIMPGSSNIFSVGTGVYSDDIDCGIYLPSSIGDYVWDDKDKDGIQKFGEFGISDVEIILYRTDEGEVERAYTDNNGNYTFSDLIDQEINIIDLDVGLVPAKSRLSGRTWIDDGNGLQDFMELSLTGITVNLLNDQMEVVQSTETNVIGRYSFTNLMNIDYFIQFDLPTDYTFTIKDASFNDFEDSDVRPNGLTDIISVTPSTISSSIDAGYILSGLEVDQEDETIVLTGFHENGGRMLSWSDSNFEPGDKYTILKSYDGNNFMMIDEVTKDIEFNLWYHDLSTNFVADAAYYKIQKRIVENILVESNIWKDQYLSKYEVHSYPIPSNDVINISFDLPMDLDMEVKILDLFGNELKEEQFNGMKAGNAKLSMNLADLPSGQYIMFVDFGIIMKTEKITIVR